jgi:dipeptidyl aminopeptidase/acylaminoacyl peptidase
MNLSWGKSMERRWLRRMLGLFAIIIIIFLLAFVVGGYFIYDSLTRIPPRCEGAAMNDKRENSPAAFFARYAETDLIVDDTPYRMATYQDVAFSARGDNLTIRGWFIPSESPSENVVIVVHGLRVCRRDPTVLLPAGMLHRNGFNVLMIDLRNHGDSDIQDGRTSAGNREYRDILGAFDYLVAQGYAPEHIGLVGISLGGGAAVIAFGEEPQLAALWVDSTFSDIRLAVEGELSRNGYPTILANAAGLVSQFTGVNLLERSPLQAMANNANRPVFIAHSRGDLRLSYTFGESLYAAAGENAELWLVDSLDHVEAIYRLPEEYEMRLVGFFGVLK